MFVNNVIKDTVLMVLLRIAVNAKTIVNTVAIQVFPNVQTASQAMHWQAQHAQNALYKTVLSAIYPMRLFVQNAQITIILTLLGIATYAIMDASNAMKVETVLSAYMGIIFMEIKMAPWFVKVVFLDVEIVNTGLVNVRNVFQDFT